MSPNYKTPNAKWEPPTQEEHNKCMIDGSLILWVSKKEHWFKDKTANASEGVGGFKQSDQAF